MEEFTSAVEPVQEEKVVLSLNNEAVKSLKSVAKWSNVLVSIYIALCAIGILFSLFAGKLATQAAYLSGQPIPPISTGAYIFNLIFSLILMGIMFIPYFYLLKSSKITKNALLQNDENLMAEAFGNHAKFFKVLTCYAIVATALMMVFFIGAILIMFLVA